MEEKYDIKKMDRILGSSNENGSSIEIDDLIDYGIGSLLLLCTLFSEIPVMSIVSLLLMTVFFIHLLQTRIVYFFKYLYYVFCVVAAVTGCVVIEFRTMDLTELDICSYFVGALPLMIFSYWVLMMTIKIYDKWFTKKTDRDDRIFIEKSLKSILQDLKTKHVTYILSIIGIGLICYIFYQVYDNPSFVLGIDRFEYAKLFDYGRIYDISLKLLKYMVIPCIVIAIYYKSKWGWAAIVVYCLYAFWVGNKFGLYFTLLCFITMIYSEVLSARIKQLGENRQSVIGMMAAMVLLIGIALFAVSFTIQEGLLDYFFSRIAQQGQLWWRTYALSNEWHISEFTNEIDGLKNSSKGVADSVGANYGIYNIMYYTTPNSIVDTKLVSGSRYTEAGFAAAYYYFGAVGTTAFAILGGLLAGISINLFLSYLRKSQFIRAFLCLRLFYMTADMMSNFLFSGFFKLASIITYLILIFGSRYLIRYSS